MKVIDVGQIRTDDPKGTRFQVLRDNHSATTPSLCYRTLSSSANTYIHAPRLRDDSVCGCQSGVEGWKRRGGTRRVGAVLGGSVHA
ncbi:uncharacterized protein CC84DRAFT_64935 [Paraphaeosphaeria sporulosa]|uniref:Uncharacterized protein n=1 Tax=Paraphaeosphaeria sporulosa TaxID=1460663 RepID=A0A177CWT4_9PLEO|nr:uncharacterized protein CC84DRAFT_64935 [Paraphaeosphaeria sporulosa]OAG12024.1 hypothetical protein CC84DRAFT_64935 [Paraphaeosphaeria sporulosa]